MKNKSVRHKELNTFKFQPFSERISNIDIDIFHKVGHEYETDTDDKQCYFYQTVENWSTLNLTESFDEFKREIKPNNLITLPQLILEKEHVVQVLLKHLKQKNPLNLQPLLEIVVAVVKDLRKDFYPYYKEFLQVLIDLLNTKNTEQLEWVFSCLAYIFKFLWRPLLKDITTVFNSLLPLLSNTRPEYINNFAAESFAFVARKVKDHNNFLSLVLKTVKNRNDGIEGCGKLFFEIIHGIDGNFHSCAETVLPLWLESLSNQNLPTDILFEILEKVVENIANNIVPDRSELLWNSLIQRLDCLLNNWQNNNDTKIENEIEFILKLLGQSIEYRNGKLLKNPTILIAQMLKFFNNNNLPETILIIGVQICVILLQSKNIRLNQEQTGEIVRRILNLNHEAVLLYFIDNITSFSSFDYLILPQFLKYCLKTNLNRNCFSVLTKLILKKTKLCNNGIDLLDWKKYTIDLNNREYNVAIENIMVEFIKNFNNYDGEHLTNYISSTICLPHLNLSGVDEIEQYLIENYLKLLENLQEESLNYNKKVKLLFLFNITIKCLIHLNKLDSLTKHFQQILEILLPLSTSKDYLVALNGIDLLITALRDNEDIIKLENLEKIDGVLRQNFSSPYHEVRLVTAHLYTFFEKLDYFNINHSNDPDVPKENWSVFTICYRVESIDSHVHTYRDQLQNLEKFNTNKPQILMCKQTKFKQLPLQYLCGCLYINFKLLWQPIISIIKQHANNLQIDEFWSIYNRELRNVVDHIKQPYKEYKLDSLNIEVFLNELYENQQKLTSKPDFYNYRSLLWKAMLQFPEIAESRTRDVSEILLTFISDEYRNYHTDTTLVLNIKQRETNIDDNNEDDDDDDDNDDNDEKLEKIIKNTRRSRDLLDFLQVFSRVQSPKSMYREPELNKLYFDLLQHKNPAIQKAALDCLMTYKYKYLVPYKEHLYNLIDDKNFRNELATFHLHQDNSSIIIEHRDNLIPIILNIVFSKMIGKLGLRTGGKSSSHIKRNLILRFLSGCKDNELFSFLQMTFRYYLQYFNDDYDLMIDEIVDNIDLERFIPPKRLQSTVNLLEIILEQCSNLLNDDLLTFIIKLMLVIGANIYGVHQQIDKVYIGYLQQLRNLRTSSIKIIEFIFKQFDRYLWTNRQINAIFRVFVWPYLNKLNTEGIHSPTSLLKLFAQWGTNPRYFQLLIKHEHGNKENFILPNIIELFLNEKSNITVINLIEEIIEKLLSLVVGEDTPQLILDDLVPIQENILERLKIDDKLNYGSCILLPYVPMILKKIQKKLETKHKNLNQKELFILTRVSELVWESDISNDILKLLLPILIKRSQCSEEIILQYLTTINNLLENSDEPRLHLKDISILFGEISYVSGRKLLVKILKKTIKNCEIVENLNAWDQKWIEQPDFAKRHDTFKIIDNLIDANDIDLDQSILIVYNCYYFLKNDKELSVHENSLYCLKKLCTYLIKQYHKTKTFDYIVNETILRLIHRGICYKKDDDFRNDSISLLGHLARECDSYHPVLNDLNKFTNKNDLEVDMFENLTHLQLYRHTKALLKFGQITKELTNNFNLRTITQFLLPLISHYLCSEKYLNKNSIIDGSIDAISVIARILPWYQYEKLLKFYLRELHRKVDYQKQLVRVNVAILDSFHFDLSKGYLIKQNIEDKPEEIIETPNEDVEDDESNEIFEEIDEIPHEEDIIEVEQEQLVKICEKTTILCKSTATRVIRTIQTILLPQLYKSLGEMTQHDLSHRLNKKRYNYEKEEEDLLRVPLSLALVKLLQRLPSELMEQNLPGIFMKLCTFLKSHMESVRRVTRETLQKIMQTLGPDYLDVLLKEMTTLLNRGYQVHVLVYTTHSILNCLRDAYKPYHIDKILLTVVNLCQMDLFGALSEEKDVVKIAAKTSEAKSTKSYDTLQILAQYTTDKCLLDLIMPIKNILQSTNSYKISNRISESFRYITLGLVDNSFVTIETLLKFAYGILSESIPELFVNKKLKQQEKQQKLLYEKEDCFIIPKEIVTRSGVRQNNVKTSTEINAHLLIEFGLRICYILLKRDRLTYEHREFLDPFVKIYKNCLKSPHIKLSTIALNCLGWCMKLDLPSVQQHITPITKDVFAILHKYASAGLNNKGDNFDLVMAAFKTMSIIVRDLKYHTITTNQLKILLLYVEQDIHSTNRQVVAFNLLKAIILRKLICDEIHDVMNKISELSIVSELDHIRVQARNVFHQYLMDYPLGDRLAKYVSFYLSQMSYEMQYGRESAIEMIQTLINTFPLNILKQQSGTLLVTLGARLVNDDVPECRKMVAKCLSSMLVRFNRTDRDPLFDVTLLWFKDKNLNHRRLAAQICGIFVSVEKSTFETRSPQLYPMILQQLSIKIDKDVNEDYERIRDHYLFQFLQMLLKIGTQCPGFFKDNQENFDDLAQYVQGLLSYPHDWVRLAAAQFIGFILSKIDIDKLSTLLQTNNNDEDCKGYLYKNPLKSVKSLILDLCDQLQPGAIKTDLAEQVIKNLVFMARVLQKIPITSTGPNNDNKINLLWLTKLLRRIINNEIVEASNQTILRMEIFKWIAAIGTILDLDTIQSILNHLLAPLVREMITTEESNAPLRQLSKEVGNLLKKRIGIEIYTRTLSNLQQNLAGRRNERKRNRAQLAVTDPDLYAQKKIKHHEKKKIAKKRKLMDRKGVKKVFKKRKTIDLDPTAEVL